MGLQPFTDNLERRMCPHIPLKERSQIRKVMLLDTKNGSIVIKLTPKTEIATYACRRRDEGSIPRAEKVW